MIKTDLAIIGAGLAGLTLNYLLRNKGIHTTIIEARDRPGGRILTTSENDEAPVEMGATWLGPAHMCLHALLDELGIDIFEQRLGEKAIYEPNSMSPHQLVTLPPQQDPSFRIKDGTSVLIQKLITDGDPDQLILSEPVRSLSEKKNSLLIESDKESIEAKIVVSTLPPLLFYKSVKTEPDLPDELQKIMSATQTWMGESIKFGLTFASPFWRDENNSGTVFSNVGPITEMYDHSDQKDEHYALKGFLNGSYFSLSRDERKEMVLSQLRKYYGSSVEQYLNYHELVWTNQEHTYTPYDQHVLPHQNNGHELYRNSYLNGKLYFAGAETSPVSPGYMDGAVHSAELAAQQIESSLSS